jgi:hypothetical protein
MNRLSRRVLGRLRFLAHWRCLEPVVIFESDDWGMERRPCADFVRTFGEPAEWASEQTETPDDLRQLYKVLERYRDETGRTATFTANFVVANPDLAAIMRNDFERYYERQIDQTRELRSLWLEGMARQVFMPQYHGRSHFWPEALLRDLRADEPGVRAMCEQNLPGGLALLKGQNWRYHSEYFDWHRSEQPVAEDILKWVSEGVRHFREIFGFAPRSTIAPNYIFTPYAVRAWQLAGIEFIQGANYRLLRRGNGATRTISHVLGERTPEGLLLMGRTVKFEPRPSRPQQDLAAALRQIKECFRHHLPVVIDTHRINYVGAERQCAFDALDSLLSAIRSFRPRFLTTSELGEAVSQTGAYRDAWTGEPRRLIPIDPPWRKQLRILLGQYNNLTVARN